MEYFSIGEFAKYCGTTVEFLKYYDREGLISPIGRDESGHRCYASYQTVDFAEVYKLSRLGFTLKQAKRLFSDSSLDEFESCLIERRGGLEAEINSYVSALSYLDGLLSTVKNLRSEENWGIHYMEESYFCLPNTAISRETKEPWWKYDSDFPEIWKHMTWSPTGGIYPDNDFPSNGWGWGSIVYDRQKIDMARCEAVVTIPAGRCFLCWYSVPTEYSGEDLRLSDSVWNMEKPLSIMAAHNLVASGDIYQRRLFVTHNDGKPIVHIQALIPLK